MTGEQRLDSTMRVRPVRATELAEAYPAGIDDLELIVDGRPSPDEMRSSVQWILEQNPNCRRIVLAVSEQEIPAIAWAEESGFRYVVDVETRSGAYSLLVTEPSWVLTQPLVLEDIPLRS